MKTRGQNNKTSIVQASKRTWVLGKTFETKPMLQEGSEDQCI